MATVTIHQAKTHLSRLIERARAGEEIVIARGREKTPVVRLVAMDERAGQVVGRRFGAMKGLARIDDRFFEPMTEEELKAWE